MPRARLELASLAAAASKTAMYTIPSSGQNLHVTMEYHNPKRPWPSATSGTMEFNGTHV